jgi:glutamate 5-kinase
VGQVLLSLDDTEDRQRHLTCRATLEELLRLGALPIINENDAISTEEIRIGDNDRLAARLAQMISADTLILLSDIDGLYTADPKSDPNASFIPEVKEITPAIEAPHGDCERYGRKSPEGIRGRQAALHMVPGFHHPHGGSQTLDRRSYETERQHHD